MFSRFSWLLGIKRWRRLNKFKLHTSYLSFSPQAKMLSKFVSTQNIQFKRNYRFSHLIGNSSTNSINVSVTNIRYLCMVGLGEHLDCPSNSISQLNQCCISAFCTLHGSTMDSNLRTCFYILSGIITASFKRQICN